MARVGTIDPRFQSSNVEMLEVTGGAFWKPYGGPPMDLTHARLRNLAAALGPAYVRVSGTWGQQHLLPGVGRAPASPPTGRRSC
jgi:hypothetical protein